jgi:DNA-nicking Smr family endonuclease
MFVLLLHLPGQSQLRSEIFFFISRLCYNQLRELHMKRTKPDANDFSFRPFGKLKSALDECAAGAPPKKDPPAPPAPPSDHDIFLQAMKDVREIKEFRDSPLRGKVVKKTMRIQANPDYEALKTLEGITRGRLPIKLADTQEYVEWTNPDHGIDRAVTKQLHEGRFAVQDLLDLHGYTVDEADARVSEFLKSAWLRGLKCVRIIHGRGLKSQNGPVLKQTLLTWLTGRFRKNVIAFATARQCDGGLGAVYILLGSRRKGG